MMLWDCYQVHHHVHRADFVWVHLVQHLLHVLKRRPHSDVVGPAPLNKLHKITKDNKASLSGVFIQYDAYDRQPRVTHFSHTD